MKLLPACILNVPINKYEEDFSFIVNGKEYKTNRITADLLSPKICKMHFNDPISKSYTINTVSTGNFQHILDLISFESIPIPENEISFLTEIIEILENKSIEVQDNEDDQQITLNSVFEQIENHENFQNFYSSTFDKEINFISSHFYEINEDQLKILENMKIETLERIIKNENLRLESEDQLLTFVNKLYMKNSMYSILYESVNFLNTSISKISEFLMIYDTFDLTHELWNSLSLRLLQPIQQTDDGENNRYFIRLLYQENKEFDGIINYFHKKYKKEIFNHINVTSSSIFETDQKDFSPSRSIMYDSQEFFKSRNEVNSWICFDFRNHRVSLSNYTIRSPNMGENGGFLKNWVIEGSNDYKSWQIIDEQNECNYLIGKRSSHTFCIQNAEKEEFRFIRLRQTGPSYNGNNLLNIDFIEFFGGLY